MSATGATDPTRNGKTTMTPELTKMLPASYRLISGPGKANKPGEGLCFMQTVALIAGEPIHDRPECACPMLTAIGIMVNDNLFGDERQTMLPLALAMAGTRSPAHIADRLCAMLRVCREVLSYPPEHGNVIADIRGDLIDLLTIVTDGGLPVRYTIGEARHVGTLSRVERFNAGSQWPLLAGLACCLAALRRRDERCLPLSLLGQIYETNGEIKNPIEWLEGSGCTRLGEAMGFVLTGPLGRRHRTGQVNSPSELVAIAALRAGIMAGPNSELTVQEAAERIHKLSPADQQRVTARV